MFNFAGSMAEVRQVLRGLLRTARQRIAPKAENAVFHEHIVAQFRDNASEQDPARVRELLRLAKDYRDYVHAVQHEKVHMHVMIVIRICRITGCMHLVRPCHT